jgi:hypothetical protein
MTPEEHTRSMRETVRKIQSGMGDIMGSLGMSALGLIKNRIFERGTNAEGEQFKPYSTKPTLTNCSALTTSACSRIAGGKGKRKELKWVTLKKGDRNIRLFELPGGYKEYRELHGRQTDHVDFSLSGTMWKNIDLISDFSQHDRGVAIIGAKGEDNKKKLEGNTKRRGDILDLSDSEIEKLKNQYSLKILNVFKENGL